MLGTTRLCAALMVPAGSGLLVSMPAAAQQQPQQLERVEVTGSSIKRIEGESALPVQVISREDIRKTGAVNVEQLLQTVSATTSNRSLTNASASGATTGSISAVSLRGLGSQRTLVLLNGRRIAPYGIGQTGDSVSVDVNSIPLAAIERVEVLKDGASAVYGSDAIAGVVNVITRRDFQGGDLGVGYGDTTRGGAEVKHITGAVGFGDLVKDRFNVMAGASYQKEGPLFGRNRKFASSGINASTLHDTTSISTFPANILLLDGSGQAANPGAPACPPPYAGTSPFLDPTLCAFDPAPLITLIPAAERVSLYTSGKLAITNDLEAFLEASYNRNTTTNTVHPVPFAGVQMSPSSPFYPTSTVAPLVAGAALPDILVFWRNHVNGNRSTTDIAESPRLVLGLSGAARGWEFDGAYLHTQSRVREKLNAGYPVLSQIQPILDSGSVNFFGPNTPAVNAQLIATEFRGEAFKITSTIDGVLGKASRELYRLAGGPLALAVGTEYRLEKFHFDAHPTVQAGDIAAYGGNFGTVDKQRKVGAAFAEVNMPFAPGLEANAAVRWDKYQGVGNSTTPKLGVRWQPARSTLFRGSVGKGFRAPSLQDLHLPTQQSFTVPGLSDPVRCPITGSFSDCQTQFGVTFAGNPNLKPERSVNATLGMVLEPVSNVSVAVDYFEVRLKDAIINGIDPPDILANLDQFGSLVTRGPVDPAFPTLPGPITDIDQRNLNIGRINLSGIDVDAKWRIPAGDIGTFTLGMAGTYFIKWDEQNRDGTYTNKVGRHNATLGGVVPRWKHYATLDWLRGPWNATLAHNWQNGYRDMLGTIEAINTPANDPRKVGSYSTFDAQTSYSGIKNLRLTLGVKNIFDRDPPYTNAGGQTSFQSGYEPLYADPRGRFVYVSANYAFK